MTAKRLFIAALILISTGCTKSSDPGSSGSPCDSINTKIINGEQCSRAKLTPIALLQLLDENGEVIGSCSGALVSPNSILTAAHCLSTEGENDAKTIASVSVLLGSVVLAADELIPHPDYNPKKVPDANDIGILRLPTNISNIQPLSILNSTAPGEDDAVIVFGAGQDEEGNAPVEQFQYKAANLKIADHEPPFYFTTNEGTGATICFGDSGGPLIFEATNATGIIGVTSAGVGMPTCLDEHIGVFIDVAAHIDFIRENAPGVKIK